MHPHRRDRIQPAAPARQQIHDISYAILPLFDLTVVLKQPGGLSRGVPPHAPSAQAVRADGADRTPFHKAQPQLIGRSAVVAQLAAPDLAAEALHPVWVGFGQADQAVAWLVLGV